MQPQTQHVDPCFVDAYVGDGPKDWRALAAAGPPWHGAIIKATQGTYYDGGRWFAENWSALEMVGRGRGDWFRGAYHYLDVRVDGRVQADFFLNVVDRAGGLQPHDLWPMVDIERAGQRADINAWRVVEVASSFARRIAERTGRSPTLYGGSWLAELGITSRMGCGRLAVARYTPKLPSYVYERIGWDRDHLMLWQFCGDGLALLPGYPTSAPGCGKVDISALVLPGGLEQLRGLLAPH